MVPPFFVVSGDGDVTAFPTISEALDYVEPIDAEGCKLFDSEGRLVLLGVASGGRLGNPRTVVVSAEQQPRHADDLSGQLNSWLTRAEYPLPADHSLGALAAAFVEVRPFLRGPAGKPGR